MKRFIAGLVALLMLSSSVCAEPWVAHNQTTAAKQVEILNPPTKMAGEAGEVNFPYTVPVGKRLIIRKIVLEPLFGAAIILWLGTNPNVFDQNKSLQTFASGGIYNFDQTNPDNPCEPNYCAPLTGVAREYQIAKNINIQKSQNTLLPTEIWEPVIVINAGQTVNMRFWANWNPSAGWIYGWAVRGELIDAP